MNAKVYNIEGKNVGTVELPARLFGVEVKPEVVHQVVVGKQSNKRHVLAHTKTRADVSGGGKKPWKQKGTGRARHGSTRSPIWIGGGVTFGPRKDRNFGVKINKKMARKALAMALSDKANEEKIVVLDEFKLDSGKTKDLVRMLANLPVGKNTLLVLGAKDPKIVQASKNVDKVHTVTANAVGLLDVLKYDTVLLSKSAIDALVKIFVK